MCPRIAAGSFALRRVETHDLYRAAVTDEFPYTLGQVFVPGGRPTVTYNARSELALEQRVLDYLDERHSILSVSGPTKTGKTVLLKSVISDGIWVSGGAIATEGDFWHAIADHLGLYTDYARESSGGQSQSDEVGGGASIAVARGDYKRSTNTESGQSETVSTARSVKSTARQGLSGIHTLVIDDFHYIESSPHAGLSSRTVQAERRAGDAGGLSSLKAPVELGRLLQIQGFDDFAICVRSFSKRSSSKIRPQVANSENWRIDRYIWRDLGCDRVHGPADRDHV